MIRKNEPMTQIEPTSALNAAAQKTRSFSTLLVDGKIIPEDEARVFFKTQLDKIGLEGQAAGQYMIQSLTRAQNLGKAFITAQESIIIRVRPASRTITPMQEQRGAGGILPNTAEERVAIFNRQTTAQRAQMNGPT
jgi:hypothetical protein